MNYVLYNKATGEIIGHGSNNVLDDIEALATDTQGVVLVEEFPDPSQKCIVEHEIVDLTSDLTLEQAERNKEHQQSLLRSQRNHLLQRSDWTQLADVSVSNKELWDNYRQALRDLPETYADIASLDEVTWPTPPES